MKQFSLWSVLLFVLYAGLGAGTHFMQASVSKKVIVAIDTSAIKNVPNSQIVPAH